MLTVFLSAAKEIISHSMTLPPPWFKVSFLATPSSKARFEASMTTSRAPQVSWWSLTDLKQSWIIWLLFIEYWNKELWTQNTFYKTVAPLCTTLYRSACYTKSQWSPLAFAATAKQNVGQLYAPLFGAKLWIVSQQTENEAGNGTNKRRRNLQQQAPSILNAA